MATTFKAVVEPLVDQLNKAINWKALEEELPAIKGKSLLLEITGEVGERWGLYVDLENNELRRVHPDNVPTPTSVCLIHSDVAWGLLMNRRTSKQLLGMFVSYQASGHVVFSARDNKFLYHARLLAWVWELIQEVAFAKGVA